MTKQIEVVGAVIVQAGLIYCTRRGPGSLEGYWEFPGGKLEAHERPEEALVREIHEELGCGVKVGAKVTTTVHEYDFGVIELTTYYCTLGRDQPRTSEHSDSTWLDPAELTTLRWAPADLPAVHQIQRDLA